MSPRIVTLDRFLLDRLVETERDPLTAEMAEGEGFAQRTLCDPRFSFAMIDGGDAVMGAGLVPYWAGRAEGWCLISKAARPRHIVAAARAVKIFLDKRQRDPAFRRVEIFVRAHERWSESFALAMGFREEGFHRAWDAAGRDYRCFARVAEV